MGIIYYFDFDWMMLIYRPGGPVGVSLEETPREGTMGGGRGMEVQERL